MDHRCPSCGDEQIIHVTKDELTTYCPTCGQESKGPRPAGMSAPKDVTISPLSRAAILKKVKAKAEEEQKKTKQVRDRASHMPQRRSR